MAEQLATLRIDIDTRLDKVSADLRKVRGSVDRSGRKIESRMDRVRRSTASAGKAFRTLRTAVVGLVAAGGLALLVRRSLDFADSIDKVSGRLGLTVEALQEFRFAAQIAGVKQQALDIGFQRFTRRLSEARDGTGEALDALKQLSVILGEDLIGGGLATEQVFVRLADAFAKIESPAKRVQLAFKLFDSEGVALLQMLGDGAAAFEAVRQQAHDMGLILSADVVQASVKAKDQLTILGTYMDTSLAGIVGKNAEGIIFLTQKLLELANAASKVFSAFLPRAEQPTDLLVRDFSVLSQTIENSRKRIVELKAEVGNAGNFITRNLAQNKLDQAIEGQRLRVIEQANLAAILRSRAPRGRTGTDTPPATGGPPGKIEQELQLTLLRQRLQLEGDFIKLVVVEFNEKRKLINETIKDEERRAEAMANLDRITGRQIQLAQEAERAFDEARNKQVRLWETFAEGIESTFERAFAAMVVEGEVNFRALKDAFVREFLEAATQEMFISPLMSALLGGKTASGKREGGVLRAIGTAIFSGAAGRASGGPVTAGRPFVVGEKGAELFVPNQSGRIVPSGGGRSNIQVNLINNGPPQEIEVQERRGSDRVVLDVILNTVAEDIVRGGRVARAQESRFFSQRRARTR